MQGRFHFSSTLTEHEFDFFTTDLEGMRDSHNLCGGKYLHVMCDAGMQKEGCTVW